MTLAPDSSRMDLGLAGRVVLVTGGVRGVGAGISAVFASQGAIVVTCARRPVEGLPFEFHNCDVRDPDAVAVLIDTIVAEHGRLDVVVNNAGGSPYALAAEASPRFHQKIVELNLLGMLHVSQAANAVMQRQDHGGSIISISSISGRRPSPGTAAYAAAKAGVDSLTTTLAVEWAPKVRVNAVVVGLVATVGGVNVGVQRAKNISTNASGTELFVNKEIFKNTTAYADFLSKKPSSGAGSNAYAIGVIYVF